MTLMDPFESIVTTSKRNHPYYGPTQSQKITASLTEVMADLETIFAEINDISDNIEALASGFIMASGYTNSLYDLKRKMYNLQDRINRKIYIEGDQESVL